MMDLFKKCCRDSSVREIREKGIYPYFHTLESRQDVEVTMEGKRRIMLGSNNYLGLTTCPEVIQAAIQACEVYGTGCSGSRFLNGTLKLHLELEQELADFLHKEAALTFSTGFQTNLGVISAMVGMQDYIIMDRENHASLYDGSRLSFGKMLRYAHGDMGELERLLQKVPERCGCLIVTDGVFSMGGDIANLPEICRLAKQYGARVMVDDAHGLGVLGDGGRGTASYYHLEDQVDIYMGTFSKSLASLGGYVAADAQVIDYIRHSSRPFIFSASIPPSNAAAALAALRYLRSHPSIVETLQDNAVHLRSALQARSVKIRPTNGERIPIIPIYTYDIIPTLEITKELYDSGVYANCVLPPAVAPSECLLRTSLMATHSKALIDEAAEIIAAVLRRHAL